MDCNAYVEGAAGEIKSITALRMSLMRFPDPSGYLLFPFSSHGPLAVIGPKTGGVVLVTSPQEEGESDEDYSERFKAIPKSAEIFRKLEVPVDTPNGTYAAICQLGWSAIENMDDEEETDSSVYTAVLGLFEANGAVWKYCGADPYRERILARERAMAPITAETLTEGYLSFKNVEFDDGAGNRNSIPALVLLRNGSLALVCGANANEDVEEQVRRVFWCMQVLTGRLKETAPAIAEDRQRLMPIVVSDQPAPSLYASLVMTKTDYQRWVEKNGQVPSSEPLPDSVMEMLQAIEPIASPGGVGLPAQNASPPVAPQPPETVISTQIGSLRHIPEMRFEDINRMAEDFGAVFVQIIGNRNVMVGNVTVLLPDVWTSWGLLPALLAHTIMEWTPIAAGTKQGLGVLLLSERDSMLGYRVGGLSEYRNRMLMLAVAEASRRLIVGDKVDFLPPLRSLKKCLMRGNHPSINLDKLLAEPSPPAAYEPEFDAEHYDAINGAA